MQPTRGYILAPATVLITLTESPGSLSVLQVLLCMPAPGNRTGWPSKLWVNMGACCSSGDMGSAAVAGDTHACGHAV